MDTNTRNRLQATRILVIGVLTLMVMGILTGYSTRSDDSQRRKARHFYLEGTLQEAAGNSDAAYEYYKRAYVTDTNYVDAAYAYAGNRMTLDVDTLSTTGSKREDLRVMRKMFEAYPADYFTTVYYAYMAQVADTLPEALRAFETLDSLLPSKSGTKLFLSQAYTQTGEYDKAIDALSRYERQNGIDMDMTLRKAALRMATGDTVGALSEIDDLIASAPRNSSYCIIKARVYDYLGQPDSAEHWLRRAERINPDDGMVLGELANHYAEAGDSATYDRYIYQALLSENFQLADKIKILNEYMGRNLTDTTYARSDTLFSVLSRQYPHEPEMRSQSARYAAFRGKYDNALEEIGYAIDADPMNAQYRTAQMSYEVLGGHPERAIQLFGQAESEGVEPDENMLMIYSSAALEAKDYSRAIGACDRMLHEYSPFMKSSDTIVDMSRFRNFNFLQLYRLSSIFQMAGDIYQLADSVGEALQAYDNAITLFPDNLMAKNNYAYFAVDRKVATPGTALFEKARRLSEETVRERPDMSTYLDTYAWILYKDGRYDQALQYQLRALKASCESDTVGDAPETVMEEDDAPDASAEGIAEVAVNDPEPTAVEADEYETVAGNFDRWLDTLGAEERKDNVELLLHLGDILYRLGRPEDAKKQWLRAHGIDPGNEEAEKRVTTGEPDS